MRGAAVSVVDEEREGGGVDDRVELEVHGEAVEDRRARRAPAQQQVQRAEDEQREHRLGVAARRDVDAAS